MKKVSLLFVSILVCKLSFGKAVNEQSARTTGYNFLQTEGVQVDASAMQLLYKTTATVGGNAVTDLYVFSAGKGFVVVSGDDNVTPVLGYSADNEFRADNIPGSVNDWLNNYSKQINYTIMHNMQAAEQTKAQWAQLQAAPTEKAAAKTTATAVAAMMKTMWDQAGYYNTLCPFDAAADTNAVTGCVATAMSQVMKYWKWPKQGTGSHSYASATYGTLSANYGMTTYQWDSMPNAVTKANTYVATLMSQTGISVNMDYSPTESAAYVTKSSSPIVNCAEYALQTYFGYKSSMQGLSRYDYADSDWVQLIRTELDAKRVVIHTGAGPSGGHCFIADGYTVGDKIHINWGWGGYYNGFFVFTNLAPGTETFNDYETIITGIEPDNTATLKVGEVAASDATIYPNPASNVIHINLQGVQTSKVTMMDMQGRVVRSLNPVNNGLVTLQVSDLAAGMYLLSLQTASGVTTKKVIVGE